jgi:hypothetical protein
MIALSAKELAEMSTRELVDMWPNFKNPALILEQLILRAEAVKSTGMADYLAQALSSPERVTGPDLWGYRPTYWGDTLERETEFILSSGYSFRGVSNYTPLECTEFLKKIREKTEPQLTKGQGIFLSMIRGKFTYWWRGEHESQ